jgi:hypothetical protein
VRCSTCDKHWRAGLLLTEASGGDWHGYGLRCEVRELAAEIGAKWDQVACSRHFFAKNGDMKSQNRRLAITSPKRAAIATPINSILKSLPPS